MPRVKLFKEEEVLHKAVELFWKKGYHATSIQDLVTFLGINRASLYDTFGGKRSLFDKALTMYRKTNMERTRTFLHSHDQVKTGFRRLFEIVLDEAVCDSDKKGCFVVNATTELVSVDKEISEKLKDNQKTMENVFYEYLLSGVKTGEISDKKDLKTISSLIYTLMGGTQVIVKIASDKKKLQASIDMALSVLD
ncbi:TetR/AcrR family transcriptional regulator [Aquimarina sp. TRL1]|uniref:TetR/AcrR family transcriptional regulator n=1 Tax=Aquimarina sp. (strain TRL1) TaxID=2736252 RepID=UPI00158D6625|nr:TetR/AcrR family transcriptional regulator [Aquimarina sp. TRL1]QKX05556.1 TetR/AcrR family transcriptional regulator [Aquimarina sp. TRL1]